MLRLAGPARVAVTVVLLYLLAPLIGHLARALGGA
jgi:hypothetical protein